MTQRSHRRPTSEAKALELGQSSDLKKRNQVTPERGKVNEHLRDGMARNAVIIQKGQGLERKIQKHEFHQMTVP
jgi:hypothetical protein